MHVRQFPLGVPFQAQLPSTIGTYWDNAIVECVDGVGGGTYSGAIILTGTTIGGSSTVNTTGSVTCNTLTVTTTSVFTGLVTCNGGATIAGTMHCTGQATFDNDARASLGCLEGKVVIADKMQPRTVFEQTYDQAGGAITANLDLTLHDSFVLHVIDSGSSANTAGITTITFTTTTVNTDLQIKKGAKFRIYIDCPAQAGGMGMASANPWPASCVGFNPSECMGPRTGDISGTGGAGDFMLWELENVGPVGSPLFMTTLIAMGGGY